MEMAMMVAVGMIGVAPAVGFWRAKVWAEKRGLQRRDAMVPSEFAAQV